MRRFLLKVWLGAFALFLLQGAAIPLYFSFAYSEPTEPYFTDYWTCGYRFVASMLGKGAATTEEVARIYNRSIQLITADQMPERHRNTLKKYQLSFEFGPLDVVESRVYVSVPGSDKVVAFGKIPSAPIGDYYFMVALWFFTSIVATGAFRLAFRSVERELLSLETVSHAMADGNRDMRVDESESQVTATLARAFNRMADQTACVISAQRELLRAVSHELCTPLSRLQVGMHLMARIEDRTERLAREQALQEDALQLDTLVDELLTYARFEVSGGPAEAQDLDPAPELEKVLERRAQDAALRKVEIMTAVTTGSVMRVDPKLLRRVAGNLIDNALRYARTYVKLSAHFEDRTLHLEVEDDGRGIPADKREAVFGAFVRLDAELDRGHGMGLAIVQRVVTWYAGRVWIEEGADGGCRVVVEWPGLAND